METLRADHIALSFGGVRAVANCTFGVAEKKITALIGPNGAGKTTMFNIINGFLLPDAGAIRFAGRDVTREPVWRRSRLGMSRTFQLSRAFRNLSIYENLLLAARTEDDLFWRMFMRGDAVEHAARIMETLAFVGFTKDPHTSVALLSYGEQKLFDLARALVNPHTLLLLDEPVAGVNPVIRKKLAATLVQLKEKGETVLLIEHDIDFVRNLADWVIVMDQGSVLAEGEPRSVLRNAKVLEAYLGPAH